MSTQKFTLDTCLESLRIHIRSLQRAGIRYDAGSKKPHPQEDQSAALRLSSLRAEATDCRRCGLCKSRTHVVFGEGSSEARLMFIGDAPDRDSDIHGQVFAGESGQLLTRIIEAIKLQRDQVYLTTVVKCIAFGGTPDDEATGACLPYLQKQIEIIQPEIICTLGPFAARILQSGQYRDTTPRGQKFHLGSITVMPTHHPELLLRKPELKKETWVDVQEIQRILDTQKPLGQ